MSMYTTFCWMFSVSLSTSSPISTNYHKFHTHLPIDLRNVLQNLCATILTFFASNTQKNSRLIIGFKCPDFYLLMSIWWQVRGYQILTFISWQEYLLALLTPLYNSVGFEDDLDDSHLDQYKRVIALSWACKLGLQDCVANSVKLYEDWMANPENMTWDNNNNEVYWTFSLQE